MSSELRLHLAERYAGPIHPGMEFHWKPNPERADRWRIQVRRTLWVPGHGMRVGFWTTEDPDAVWEHISNEDQFRDEVQPVNPDLLQDLLVTVTDSDGNTWVQERPGTWTCQAGGNRIQVTIERKA